MFKSLTPRKLFEIGGILAGLVLIGFGIASTVLAIDGKNTVNKSLRQEYIVGTPDMTPAAIRQEARDAKLPSSISLPTCSVANQTVDTGTEARCFAQYMRIHALEATGGLAYAQMGRYLAKTPKGDDGLGGTSDEAKAVVDPKTSRPVDNPRRQVWVTETALSTALNVSYMADRLSLFSLVIGIALLLSGIGFIILAVGGALRRVAATTPKEASRFSPAVRPTA